METQKINLPEPCPQAWEHMTPKENGRHCASCNTVVVDFTKMDLEEIQAYFKEQHTLRVCGHYKIEHVETPQPFLHKKLMMLQSRFEAYTSYQFLKKASLFLVFICMLIVGCKSPKNVRGVNVKYLSNKKTPPPSQVVDL